MSDKIKVGIVFLALVLPIIYFYSIDTQAVIAQNTHTLIDSSNIATFKTSKGDFSVELRADIAPKAVENFVTLVKTGYYKKISFHRTEKGVLIQSGDPTNTGNGGNSIWNKPFEDEFKNGVVFDKGFILAMANSGKNTNRSQFFITIVPLMELNGKHTIFGYVIDGYDVVKDISATDANTVSINAIILQ